MENDDLVRSLRAQLKKANSLTAGQREELLQSLDELQARREVDKIDNEWEIEFQKHLLIRRGKSGQEWIVLPNKQEALGTMFMGIALAVGAVWMTIRMIAEHGATATVWVLFSLLTIAGTWMILHGRWLQRKTEAFNEAKKAYLARRKKLFDEISKTSSPPIRYCANCGGEKWLVRQVLNGQ
jgi:hypothetical protein